MVVMLCRGVKRASRHIDRIHTGSNQVAVKEETRPVVSDRAYTSGQDRSLSAPCNVL